ncbi:pyrroloquinoline quinone-dependent dehydrogenase [Steroidobacter sp.]|uniref:pyrroloquinoline quinone-dependent dehydrogenase n=1 Tax=Steroidobacter sp. TaxID=1978227 RepID=UPI001A493E9A|nr:pyrroloquinoline quinone-dependent dehydrogenase [Steroidobacter sp.]MBL8266144.1 pyrroloquinoline quinone-dependent dehydrogenase [Steroidobacter sp.]
MSSACRRLTTLSGIALVVGLGGLAVGSLQAAPPHRRLNDDDAQWQHYGGDAGGTRHAVSRQITPQNVEQLEIAWTYRTGELGAGFVRADKLAFEATPILIDDTLYLSTPTDIVIALDAATGKHRWRHDPKIARHVRYAEATSRGVSWWTDETAEAGTPCAQRIVIGTLDARLIALDARDGNRCAAFGTDGSVDLTAGARPTERGQYLVTSPPAIYKDLVVVGSAIGDNRGVELERGIVRAFDARTGAQRWSWDPIPATPADATARGWSEDSARRTGGANAWSIFSVDVGRGLIFVPTGSASPDFFGGERPGLNNYANSLVALRAETGEVVWHRQLIHHDLWDYDLAAQPMLIDFERDGKAIPAVVQATKTGMLFVFDRETGEPVFEIVERPVPPSNVPGELASPTQPFPATPALVSHAAITPQDAWGLTVIDRARCRELIGKYRSEGLFTPPSLQGTILSPSFVGGVNWGSLAFDPERQLILAAVNHLPMVATLVPRAGFETMRKSGSYKDSEFAQQTGTPYGMRREMLASPLGLPCTAPPWGSLAAVDLRRNAIRWQVVLGSTRDRTPWFVPSRTIGMPNMGGPLVTAGGLVFIGAATDNYLRAFDIATGSELWKGRLPAGGQATPMSYELGGRQFVVIAAGGHGGLKTKQGDYVIAFALPPAS